MVFLQYKPRPDAPWENLFTYATMEQAENQHDADLARTAKGWTAAQQRTIMIRVIEANA